MKQVSLRFSEQKSWAILQPERYPHTLQHHPLGTEHAEGDKGAITFKCDLSGKVHSTQARGSCNQINHGKDEPLVAAESTGRIYQERSEIAEHEISTSSPVDPPMGPKTLPLDYEGPASFWHEPPSSSSSSSFVEDFSSYGSLHWSDNKKDWEKYVNVKPPKTEDIVSACSMLKPTQPMHFTPDIESMQYMFNSANDMEEIISKVTSEEPGFGIVCKSWAFPVSEHGSPAQPAGHICDILTVTESGKVCLWVVEEHPTESSMEYLMITGRMLRYQLVMRDPANSLSSLQVGCHLLSLNKCAASRCRVTPSYLDEYQDLPQDRLAFTHGVINFEALQRALARVVLCRESPLKRCLGDHTSVMLSAQQAEVLMHKAKVNYISGPAGSGKSWTAACLYQIHGKVNSVYICTTSEFVEYLKFNDCVGMLVESDRDLLKEIESGSFDNKTCVIIDDSHNFACTRKSFAEALQTVTEEQADVSVCFR